MSAYWNFLDPSICPIGIVLGLVTINAKKIYFLVRQKLDIGKKCAKIFSENYNNVTLQFASLPFPSIPHSNAPCSPDLLAPPYNPAQLSDDLSSPHSTNPPRHD